MSDAMWFIIGWVVGAAQVIANVVIEFKRGRWHSSHPTQPGEKDTT